MEEEINNFIMVWSSILISACYCYAISKLVPNGRYAMRFLTFLPVIFLFFRLPLCLNSVSLALPTAYFATWLTTFKLLLLVFGTGPLSHPSLPFSHFLLIFCLPINLSAPNKIRNNENSDEYPFQVAKKGFVLILLIGLSSYCKDRLPRNVFLFLICIYIYIGLEVLLGVVVIVGQILLGVEVDPPFDEPYLSTSLQDFWGRRWNRVSSNSLRLVVFQPTRRHMARVVGPRCAWALAMIAAFVVSDLMHEVMFYYLGRVRPAWGTPTFFLLHGIWVVIESTLKRRFRFHARWQLPQIITGPFVFGFSICTFMWMALPELMEHNVDGRVIEEYAALGRFVKDLGLTFIKRFHAY